MFACLEVNQSISSKRAIPKHNLLPKPTMQHTVTCTRRRSWVTLQLQNHLTALGIVNLQVSYICDHTLPQERLPSKYPTLIQGIGKLRGVEVGKLDERINLVTQQPRRSPFHICQKVGAELHELEKRYTCN